MAAAIRAAVTEHDCTDLPGVKACTKAATSCGSCVPLVKKLMTAELEKAGLTVSRALCEHVEMSRARRCDAVRVMGITSFSKVMRRFGTHPDARGCDVCKPVVALILASVADARPDLVVREAFVDVQEPAEADVVASSAELGLTAVVVPLPLPLLLSVGFHVRVDFAAAVEEVAAGLAAGLGRPVIVGYGAGSTPRIPEAVAAARVTTPGRAVIASYLLVPGFFHDRVLDAGADMVRSALAPDERIVAIVLDRYAAAAALLRGSAAGRTPRAG